MKLSDMEKDSRNKFHGEKVCDPCVAQTSTQLTPKQINTLTDEVQIAIRTATERIGSRKGFGKGHRSDKCWSDRHNAWECRYAWCDCHCHTGERDSDRLQRATQRQAALPPDPPTLDKKTGLTGTRILVDGDDGQPPRWMLWLTSGELVAIEQGE